MEIELGSSKLPPYIEDFFSTVLLLTPTSRKAALVRTFWAQRTTGGGCLVVVVPLGKGEKH